jgi:hypothetical protein
MRITNALYSPKTLKEEDEDRRKRRVTLLKRVNKIAIKQENT